ncbi:alpha/beta hydrolase [Halostella sp. JP-L12]|uniref:dienelactone hydrolase family protein n=1 Tax=Halostella TaxID=1843185 RepID=UPI000EF75B94|nr:MULTISPECIES: dienelactone hydrolase family protein [Halostella]NHN47045.1 alpha/beta hydrolase [Halostella sp. JP-L12]
MSPNDVLLPGGRDVRGTLDGADGAGDAATCVVACPPHPQHRGHRGDDRLVSVSDALADRGTDCLRFDYGDWDEGYGEREDARNAVRWAAERYDRVGLFGYSFGGAMALLAGATVDREVVGVSVLAPAPKLADDLDAAAALTDLGCPAQVIYGERDGTVDATPVAAAARERGDEVVELSADHFFLGKHDRIGERVADFFDRSP